MAAEHLFNPLVAGALFERRAEARHPGRRRFLFGQWPLVGEDQRVEERGGGEVGDAEGVADEVLVRAELGFEPVEGGEDLAAGELGRLLAFDAEAQAGEGAGVSDGAAADAGERARRACARSPL